MIQGSSVEEDKLINKEKEKIESLMQFLKGTDL